MRGAAAGAAHTPHPAPWTTRATAVDTAAATAAPTSMLERPLPFSVLGSRAPASALGARMITGCLASTDGKTDGPPAIAHRDGGRRRGPQRAPRPQAQAAATLYSTHTREFRGFGSRACTHGGQLAELLSRAVLRLNNPRQSRRKNVRQPVDGHSHCRSLRKLW